MLFTVTTSERYGSEPWAATLSRLALERGHRPIALGERADFEIMQLDDMDSLRSSADACFTVVQALDGDVVSTWDLPGDHRNAFGERALPRDVREAFVAFLDQLDAPVSRPGDLQIEIEVFAIVWRSFAERFPLAPDDRRVGDEFAAMASQVSSVEQPPRGVLRETFHWFASKADLFASNFAEAGGKAAGTAAAVVAGAAIGAELDQLREAIRSVLRLLR